MPRQTEKQPAFSLAFVAVLSSCSAPATENAGGAAGQSTTMAGAGASATEMNGGVGATAAGGTVAAAGGMGPPAGGSGGVPSANSGGTSALGGASGATSAGTNGSDAGAGGTAGAASLDRSQRKLLLRDEGNSAVHYVDLADPSKNWHQNVPTGRDLQLVGAGHFLMGTESGYQERALSDGALVSELKTFPGTLDAHRLHNGNTLLVGVDFHGGKGIVLVEVEADGDVARQIAYPGSYARLVRETGSGHFLVTADTHVFEGDAEGKVVWDVTVQDHDAPHAWEALRLASGDVLIAAGYSANLQIFGADKQLKQRITGGGAEANPHFFADVQVMPGGSFIVANWQGHGVGLGGMGLQVLEYDLAGQLVWSWKQDASFVSSLQQLIVLDGLDTSKLEVENPMTGILEPVN